MTNTNKSANSANKANANANVNVTPMVTSKKQETATQKAARKAARAAKLEAQKQETARRHFDAKTAANYGTYGLITDARNTPAQACKRFWVSAMAICGGKFAVILQDLLGKKQDFAAEYAPKVAAAFEAKKNAKNYTDFLVWGVVYKDLKQYTHAAVACRPELATAFAEIDKAVAARKAAK